MRTTMLTMSNKMVTTTMPKQEKVLFRRGGGNIVHRRGAAQGLLLLLLLFACSCCGGDANGLVVSSGAHRNQNGDGDRHMTDIVVVGDDKDRSSIVAEGKTATSTTLRGSRIIHPKQQEQHEDHDDHDHDDHSSEEHDILRTFSNQEDSMDEINRVLQESTGTITRVRQSTVRNTTSTTTTTTTTTTDTTTTTGTTSTCTTGNTGADSFTTLVAIALEGNRSLITDDAVNLLAVTFATTYNSRTASTSSSSIINSNDTDVQGIVVVCDPLFRSISTVRATANVSLPGRSNWNIVGNNVPIRPVRRRHRRAEEEEEEDNNLSFDSILWESLLKSHLVEGIIDGSDHDQQQQQRDLQLKQPGGGAQLPPGLNRTVANYNLIVILLDITGSCRGCNGGDDASDPRFFLFDDTSDQQQEEQEQVVRQRQRQVRGLQQQQLQQEQKNEEGDCTCPANSMAPNSTIFQDELSLNVEDLNENGDLELGVLESVDVEFIDVIERPCESVEQPFIRVHFVSGIAFDPELMYARGANAVQEVEELFRDTYNDLAQELCDPLFRTIDFASFVSYEIDEDDNTNNGNQAKKVTLEFIVEATCRGDGCTDPGCLFEDENGDCLDGSVEEGEGEQRRQRRLVDEMIPKEDIPGMRRGPEDTQGNLLSQSNPHLHAASTTAATNRIGTTISGTHIPSGTTRREVQHHRDRHLQLDDERCICRKGRSVRPPGQDELRGNLQQGLDKISETFLCIDENGKLSDFCPCQEDFDCSRGRCEDNTCQPKLGSCERCDSGSECLSGYCVGSVCAEADGLLSNSCECLDHESCLSGRCKELDCQTVCSDEQDNGGVGSLCEEVCSGVCTEKISDTCFEPCIHSMDCMSGNCGTITCLPSDGTNLEDGCFSASGLECQSGYTENNVCAQQRAVCDRCTIDTNCLSGICVGGICAAADGFLSDGCECLDHDSCLSGRCKDLGSAVCETICAEDGGSCEEVCFGICTPKIVDTCTEQCIIAEDCESETCGSVVCLPNDGTKLEIGCLSNLESECVTGSLENSICIATPGPTLSPSSQPSSQPTTSPSSQPTMSPSSRPSMSPSSAPTTPQPSTSPSQSPTTSPSFSPSQSPTTSPSSSPTRGPTTSPSSPPTQAPSPSPSELPTATPSVSPSALPTATPSVSPTPAPTPAPTPGPTQSPSVAPTQCNSPADCDDFNGCTDDVCDSSSTCVNTPNTANTCTDNDNCTADQCTDSGECRTTFDWQLPNCDPVCKTPNENCFKATCCSGLTCWKYQGNDRRCRWP